jgi:colanic acid/amylovoran biosynthesis protein
VKRIFVDIYMAFNLGDDLFLDILAKKYPDCQFTLNYLGSNYDGFIEKYQNIKRRDYSIFKKIGQRLKINDYINDYASVAEEHDALLFIGGSIFREEAYHQSLYENRMKLVTEFKKKDKSVFILGANFGPYETDQFHQDYSAFFEQCDDVCFRDVYSYDLFKKIPQVRYAPDIVFQLNLDEYKLIEKRKRVGFSIIDVRHKQGLSSYYNSYIDSTVKAIQLLVSKGYECYLMSFCEQEGDLQVIGAIMSRISSITKDQVYSFEYKGNLQESIHLISTFELFVAARFHANIIALILGIGVMPIIYSKKTSNMFADINLDNILINMEDIHLQSDEGIINKSFENKTSLELISDRANHHFTKISKFIGA